MSIRLLKSMPAVLLVLVVVLVAPSLLSSLEETLRDREDSQATIGDPAALQAAYAKWRQDLERRGDPDALVVPIHYSKALSARVTGARGVAKLDLKSGMFDATIEGLPEAPGYDVWLVDNRPGPGRSVKPEAGDGMIRLGALERTGASRRLRTGLDPDALRGFEIDLVVVTPQPRRPGESVLLVGSPSLFQRLYVRERANGTLDDPAPATADRDDAPAFARLIPAPDQAHASGTSDAFLGLVARGEKLFFNETFAGNGRTCGTCHPAENNFAIDPAFIATLPPKNPLFVAEFNADLAKLEIPVLMREFGLILENTDGFDDPTQQFTMRGVPHTLALSTSLGCLIPNSTRPCSEDPGIPNQRTGWSGDGAPNSGSLRDFATGAVTQHFPRTLKRRPGIDFRLPTERELDALEAFQLSLGRQEDINLEAVRFKGTVAERGREIFLASDDLGGTVAAGKCNLCHANAGANSPFSTVPDNRNFDTGVENLPDQPARVLAARRGFRFPRDGGFGRNPQGGFDVKIPNDDGSFGNREFNTPPLIEAADTGPFFHNNSVATLEEAVNFYNSAAFNATGIAQGIGGIRLQATQVEAVAAMLRVLNGLENIRASVALDERALHLLGSGAHADVRRLLQLSRADIVDAIQVLRQGGLHPEAVLHLKQARALIAKALNTSNHFDQVDLIRRAVRQQRIARADMVQA